MTDDLIIFGKQIQQLLNRNNLSEEETYQAFKQILCNKQPDLHQGAFLAALVSKGETTDEIVGAYKAIDEFDTVHANCSSFGPVCDNSGTGMDQQKTFNVSSAAAIIAASFGVSMARHGARAITSQCGTVDILEAVGVDVDCPLHVVENSIRQAGIGVFNGMSAHVHPGALGRILSQIRFGSTLNIAASLANPARPVFGVRGVYNGKLIEPTTEVMARIGYTNFMVLAGQIGSQASFMDEVSICGPTQIIHSKGAFRKKFVIKPEDFGITPVRIESITFTGDRKREAKRFVDVLSGKEQSACTDFTCINAAAILVVAGKCDTFQEGIAISQQIIRNGNAILKLRDWVNAQQWEESNDGRDRFENLLNG